MTTSALKNKISQAIQKMPTNIALKRFTKEDDGFGGYTTKEVEVATFAVYLNNSKSKLSVTKVDGAEIRILDKIKFLAVKEDTYVILQKDYFSLNGIKYEIVYPKEMMGAYYEVDVIAYV